MIKSWKTDGGNLTHFCLGSKTWMGCWDPRFTLRSKIHVFGSTFWSVVLILVPKQNCARKSLCCDSASPRNHILMSVGVWSFQFRHPKLAKYLHSNQHTERKFLKPKINLIFLKMIFLYEYVSNLENNFFYQNIFNLSHFWKTLFSKIVLNFWRLSIPF